MYEIFVRKPQSKGRVPDVNEHSIKMDLRAIG